MNTETPMSPADIVIERFRAERFLVSDLARMLKTGRSTVARWQRPKSAGGTGGLIPSNWHAMLLRLARENRVKLAPADFIDTREGGSDQD